MHSCAVNECKTGVLSVHLPSAGDVGEWPDPHLVAVVRTAGRVGCAVGYNPAKADRPRSEGGTVSAKEGRGSTRKRQCLSGKKGAREAQPRVQRLRLTVAFQPPVPRPGWRGPEFSVSWHAGTHHHHPLPTNHHHHHRKRRRRRQQSQQQPPQTTTTTAIATTTTNDDDNTSNSSSSSNHNHPYHQLPTISPHKHHHHHHHQQQRRRRRQPTITTCNS